MNLDNVFIEPKLSKLTKPILCIEMTGTGNRRALLAAALPPRTHRVMARNEAVQAASRCEEARRSNLDREYNG